MKYLIRAILLVFLAACNTADNNQNGQTQTANSDEKKSTNEQLADGDFLINGKIANAASASIFLDKYSIMQRQQQIAATQTDAEGSFTLKGKLNEKGLYLIRVNQNANWLLVLEGGTINFTADAQDIYRYKVSGAPESEACAAFIITAGENQLSINQLTEQYNQARASGNIQNMLNIQQQYAVKFQESQNYLRTFIDTTNYPLLAVFAAGILNTEENAEYLDKFVEKVSQQLPGSAYVAELKEKLESVTKFAAGRVAPDFSLKSPKGEEMPLSATKGKVVLVDFWASWCRPCRVENPNVVRLYDKYKSKGFEVYSVSLDQNMQKWVDAIKQDNLKWKHHGSNLLGWQCPVAKMYEVSSIPNTYLLDKEGKIIARNLRGEELEAKLKEIFGS